MVNIHGIATKLGKCLTNLTEQPEVEEIYSYGLEIILGGLLKIFMSVALAILLGMLHLTVAAVLTIFYTACCQEELIVKPTIDVRLLASQVFLHWLTWPRCLGYWKFLNHHSYL